MHTSHTGALGSIPGATWSPKHSCAGKSFHIHSSILVQLIIYSSAVKNARTCVTFQFYSETLLTMPDTYSLDQMSPRHNDL